MSEQEYVFAICKVQFRLRNMSKSGIIFYHINVRVLIEIGGLKWRLTMINYGAS